MDPFYLKDGKTVNDLVDLVVSLEKMDNDTFAHHVNAEKNDFAEWLKQIGENDAARELMYAGSKTDAELRLSRLIIKKRLKRYRGGDTVGKRDNS